MRCAFRPSPICRSPCLSLEAPRAEDLALVQALVQGGELLAQAAAVAQALGADLQLATEERHAGATGIVVAAGATQYAALQVHHPGVLGQRHGAQGTAAVVARRQVDQRTGGLADVAGATAQQQVATPAVFIHIVEAGLASGQVDARAIAQPPGRLRRSGSACRWVARPRYPGGSRGR